MPIGKTEKGTKKISKEEKLAILKEVSVNGVKVILQKHELYPATFYYWKRQLEFNVDEGLDHSEHPNLAAEVKTLTKTNETLKILLAEKELESRLLQ